MRISRTAGWLIALAVGGCSGSSNLADRLPNSSPVTTERSPSSSSIPQPPLPPESVSYLPRLPAAVSPFSLDVSQAPLEANPPPYMAQRASESMSSLGLGGPALPSDDDWFTNR